MQTYSTIKLLESLGHQVTLINLVHPQSTFKAKYKSLYSLWDSIVYVDFSLFRVNYFKRRTKRMNTISPSCIPECDYFVVGSDQVWNEEITSPINKFYFFDFAENTPRVSLSSSFGKDKIDWSVDYQKFVSDSLHKFKAISVRESSGVQICKELLGLKAVQLLDPTLLWGDFEPLMRKSAEKRQVYPFLFKNSEEADTICHTVSTSLGIPLFTFNYFTRLFGRSPKSWLERMKYSDFIITDSFHGLAFSLIFHKRFIVLCADSKKFTRLKSLLELVHLENRYISSSEDLESRINVLKEDIDYSKVDAILQTKRIEAIVFLKMALT